MSPIVQEFLAWVLARILTADVIKGSEVELIAFLRSMAAKSSAPVILNGLIDALAIALGTP